ncbi:MAG: hypothetical protein ACRCTD_11100 [Beijerinckiaceae bacterium]
MGIKDKFKAAQDKYKKIKKAKEYYSVIKNLIDEDTRNKEIFKQGLKWSMKLGEKLAGVSLTNHPYFKIHKLHFEALGTALAASSTHHNAMKALSQAIASADSTAELSKQVEDLLHRYKGVKLIYWHLVGTAVQDIRLWNSGSKDIRRDLQEAGIAPSALETKMDEGVMVVRTNAIELYFDAVALLAMVDIEFRAASEAYGRFKSKVDKLQKSSSQLNNVAGKQAELDQQWAWYDRERAIIDGKSTAAAAAVADPSAHAKIQRDHVAGVVDKIAAMCDAVMSDDIYDPDKLMLAMGKS